MARMAGIVSVCLDVLVLVLLSVYDALTLPFYLLVFRPWERRKLLGRPKLRVCEKGSDHVVLEPSPYLRRCLARESMLSSNEVITLDDLFLFGSKRFGSRRCLGFRPITKIEICPRTKQIKRFAKDEYRWKSYDQVVKEAHCLAKALRQELGLEPGQKVALVADTRMEWMISAVGIFRADLVLVTLNSHLDKESQLYGLNESGVSVLIVSKDKLESLDNLVARTNIRKVILLPSLIVTEKDYSNEVLDEIAKKFGLESTMSYLSLINQGSQLSEFERQRDSDNDALMMYTSGTTGCPKAVVLSHNNLITSVQDCCNCFTNIMDEQHVLDTDNFYSYAAFLPLSHIFELQQELLMLIMGIPIGYSSPFTLSDSGTMVPENQKGDALILKPTNMSVVPLILDRIYKRINAKLERKGEVVSTLFKRLIQYRVFWQKQQMDTPILNQLIFNKFRALLGSNIQVVVVGGAPISGQVQDFIRATLGTHTLSGYGLTETSGGVLLPDHFDFRPNIVGYPLLRAKLRIESWAEGGYEAKNLEGELQFSGPSLLNRYYRRSDMSDESIFEDSQGQKWFRTGDIGKVIEDGVVMIVDRKKELAKLQTGLYVSCSKIEAILRTHPIVEQVCVVARSTHSFVTALIVVDSESLRQLAKLTDLQDGRDSNDDINQLCLDNNLNEEVSKLLRDHCVDNGLGKAEIPKEMLLIGQAWTMEQGLVTASLKIKRKPLEQHYKSWLDHVYC